MTTPTPESHEPEASTKRRMPEHLKRYMIKMQGGKWYLPAAYRVVWFRDECPDWGILTEILEGGQQAGFASVRASIVTPEGRILAQATKTETQKDFPAGWVEKAETGAIGRALALCGFGTQFSPDLDEGQRIVDSPQDTRGNGGSRMQRVPSEAEGEREPDPDPAPHVEIEAMRHSLKVRLGKALTAAGFDVKADREFAVWLVGKLAHAPVDDLRTISATDADHALVALATIEPEHVKGWHAKFADTAPAQYDPAKDPFAQV